MVTGIVTTAVTKYLPGPGSHVVRQELEFVKPVHHYATLQIHFEVVAVYQEEHSIDMRVLAYNENEEEVVKGLLTVAPPHHLSTVFERALDNF